MQAWFIHCRTGCTCCSDRNHYRGPYQSEECAIVRRDNLRRHPILRSQYARNGIYEIIAPVAVEKLPDGRLIIEDRVFPGFVTLLNEGVPAVDDRIGTACFAEG